MRCIAHAYGTQATDHGYACGHGVYRLCMCMYYRTVADEKLVKRDRGAGNWKQTKVHRPCAVPSPRNEDPEVRGSQD
jgi:hypothetical protein